MAGRGEYDRGLSSAMSRALRHGDRGKPMAVRADGLAHLDDLSHALDATPDEIMLVVQQSIKKSKGGCDFRFEHAVHQETGVWIRAARGHSMRTIQAQLLRTSPAECLRLDPPPPGPGRRQPQRPHAAAAEVLHPAGPASPPTHMAKLAKLSGAAQEAQRAPGGVAGAALFPAAAPPQRQQPWAQPQQQQPSAQHAPAEVAAEARRQPQAPLQPAAPQQQQLFAEHAPAGAGAIFLAAGALAAEPSPWPSPQPFGTFLRGDPLLPAECRHAGVGAALAEEVAVAESPPPLPPAPQCRTAAEAAKQSPMPLSQLQWPTAGEASSPAAAASATGRRDKKNKQQRRVDAARPGSPEMLPRQVEDAVRPESPQRLQQVAHQLSDENLQLRRRIFELEAELLLLRPLPQTTQRLERQDC